MNPAPSLAVWSFALVSVALSAAAQLQMKIGMSGLRSSGQLAGSASAALMVAVTNPWVLGGLACYAASAVLWLFVLSQMPLSTAYPLIGLGIALVVVLSTTLLGETLGLTRLVGISLIVSGVVIIGASS